MTRETETRGNDASLYAGFDVGSSFVHYAVLRSDKSVVYSPAPLMHFANPLGALREVWEDVQSIMKELGLKDPREVQR